MQKKNVKKSLICQAVDKYSIDKNLKKVHIPRAGDVGIFRVKNIGKHDSVQGVNGNNLYIFPNDNVMLAFGNRYATEQFEGYVPDCYMQEYHILGKGGAVGILRSLHEKYELIGPTTMKFVGYAVGADNSVLNTKDLDNSRTLFNANRTRNFNVILSLGSGMDSGKTTTAAFLARGLNFARERVAYIKLTGTVYTKDAHYVRDCGARAAVDFSLVGFPSTYLLELEELLDLYDTLLEKVEFMRPTVVIVEIADGILQRETSMLLNSRSFMQTVGHVVFSASDSMSALQGINQFSQLGISLSLLSGLFTRSPLLIDEVRQMRSVPVLTRSELASPRVIEYFNIPHSKPIHEQEVEHTSDISQS